MRTPALKPDRLADMVDRLRVALLLIGEQAQQMESIGVFGPDRHDPAIGRLRRLEPAGAMVVDPDCENFLWGSSRPNRCRRLEQGEPSLELCPRSGNSAGSPCAGQPPWSRPTGVPDTRRRPAQVSFKPVSRNPWNGWPNFMMPLTRSAGVPSTVIRVCAKTRFRVTRSTSTLPSTQLPSGAGAKKSLVILTVGRKRPSFSAKFEPRPRTMSAKVISMPPWQILAGLQCRSSTRKPSDSRPSSTRAKSGPLTWTKSALLESGIGWKPAGGAASAPGETSFISAWRAFLEAPSTSAEPFGEAGFARGTQRQIEVAERPQDGPPVGIADQPFEAAEQPRLEPVHHAAAFAGQHDPAHPAIGSVGFDRHPALLPERGDLAGDRRLGHQAGRRDLAGALRAVAQEQHEPVLGQAHLALLAGLLEFPRDGDDAADRIGGPALAARTLQRPEAGAHWSRHRPLLITSASRAGTRQRNETVAPSTQISVRMVSPG